MGFAFGSTAMPTMPVVAFMPRARRGPRGLRRGTRRGTSCDATFAALL